jgi:hypothetical protein
MKLGQPYEENGKWWQNVLEFSRDDLEPKGTQWKSKSGWRDVSLPGSYFSPDDSYRVPYQGNKMKQFSLKPSTFERKYETLMDVPENVICITKRSDLQREIFIRYRFGDGAYDSDGNTKHGVRQGDAKYYKIIRVIDPINPTDFTVKDIPDLRLFSVNENKFFKYNDKCYHWMENGCIYPASCYIHDKATPLNYVVEVTTL